METPVEEKKQISYGRIISKADFDNNKFMPNEVKRSIKDVAYYLYIYIPSDDIVKLSIFPCQNPAIKKVLIRLKEFSPELVKGISDVLKHFNLGDSTIHTTGLCFSGINCFYETYLDASSIKERNLSLDQIKEEFLKVSRIEEVKILDVVL